MIKRTAPPTSNIIKALAYFFFFSFIVDKTDADVFPVQSDLLLHVSHKHVLLVFFVKQLNVRFVGDIAAL